MHVYVVGWVDSSTIAIKKNKAWTLKYGLSSVKTNLSVHAHIHTHGYDGHNPWHTVNIIGLCIPLKPTKNVKNQGSANCSDEVSF